MSALEKVEEGMTAVGMDDRERQGFHLSCSVGNFVGDFVGEAVRLSWVSSLSPLPLPPSSLYRRLLLLGLLP
jgi:hypothetical protein